MSRHLRQFSYFLALECNLELPLGWSVLLACQIVLGDHSKNTPVFLREFTFIRILLVTRKCVQKSCRFSAPNSVPQKWTPPPRIYTVLSSTRVAARRRQSHKKGAHLGTTRAQALIDRGTLRATQANRCCTASVRPRHPRAWAHPFATRLLAPTGQPACTCPYRFREKSVTSPPLRGAPCRPHLHKAANWQCYRQACLSYHGVGDSGRSAPPPPLPRGDTACTISLVSAGVCNGRCVHSPGLDGIHRALRKRCATAQQLQSTCKSDENHVETIQKGPKTKFMAIKRRFTRVLKTKTDGPPFI